MAATMTALECRDLESLLQPYLDGEFERGEASDLEAHLALCAPCRARVDGERQFRARLRAASLARPPAAFRKQLEGSLRRERRWVTVRRLVRPEVVAALAACAGFLTYFYGQQFWEPLIKDSVSNHAHNLPLEISGNEQQISRWFAGKVDFRVHLPHLRHVSVAGARLSHVSDRNAAYVVYEGPKAHRVSLFVFDDPRAPLELGLAGHRERINDRDVLLANEHGYNVAMWRDNEIVYSLVSDLDERDIVDLLSGGPSKSVPAVAARPAESVSNNRRRFGAAPGEPSAASSAESDCSTDIEPIQVQQAALHAP